MRIDILTLFPGMFSGPFSESIIKIAKSKGLLKIHIHNLRDWTTDRHKTADDKPYGGGAGMVMKVEPIYRALKEIFPEGFIPGKRVCRTEVRGTKVLLLSPSGARREQDTVKDMALLDRLLLICGHYEGIDERVREMVDGELSIGDYVLTCGELPACVVVDSVCRLLPGVLGHEESVQTESFEGYLLEYPQYTRPAEFEGMKVPEIVTSGDHEKISRWRKRQAVTKTRVCRPDLYEKYIKWMRKRKP